MRRFFLPVFFLLFFASFVWGETKKVEPLIMPSARFNALGGGHTPLADDFYSIFLNPAAFAGVKDEFSAAEITLNTYGPVFELLDLFRNSSGSIEDLDLSGLMGPGGFSAGFDLGGPLSLGWVGRGLGLGIFNKITTTASISGATLRPVVSVELLFVGGYGFKIFEHKGAVLEGGFLAKGFYRGALNMKTTIFSIDSLDPADSPLSTHLGFGLDLGLKLTILDMISLAVVCYDVYSPVLVTYYDKLSDFTDSSSSGSDYAIVKRRLNFGISYRIRSDFLDRYISRLTIATSYHDFLNVFSMLPRNLILNLGVGVEVALLKALTFRIGMTDALPAFGFGLDLNFMTLDFAIFGKELGLDPGKHPVYAMSVGMLFRY